MSTPRLISDGIGLVQQTISISIASEKCAITIASYFGIIYLNIYLNIYIGEHVKCANCEDNHTANFRD